MEKPTSITPVLLDSITLVHCIWVRGYRGGSRNSLRGGGVLGQNSSKGGRVRVQVRGNFHILTSKKKRRKTSEGGGGLNTLPPPPPGSATGVYVASIYFINTDRPRVVKSLLFNSSIP